MSAADIELLVADHARRIAADAEALLTVAAWPDLPAGMVVLPLDGCDYAGGMSIGSGHNLALAHGCRPGAVAVRVDVAGAVRTALTAAPDLPAIAVNVAGLVAETVAIHEASHALVADLDAEHDIAGAIARVRAAESATIRCGADAHGPRWAAAVVVLTGRAIRLRPANERHGREDSMRRDLEGYGIDAAAVAAALGDVADEVVLRRLLAAGGDAARRVAAACPPEPERQAVIEHRRRHGAAGGSGTYSMR